MLNNYDPSTFDLPKAGGRVHVIGIDGTRTVITEGLVNGQPTLDGLYEHLKCALVEVIELPNHRGRQVQMIVDEEGLLKGLELNPIASGLAQRPIVGIAVLLMGKACWA